MAKRKWTLGIGDTELVSAEVDPADTWIHCCSCQSEWLGDMALYIEEPCPYCGIVGSVAQGFVSASCLGCNGQQDDDCPDEQSVAEQCYQAGRGECGLLNEVLAAAQELLDCIDGIEQGESNWLRYRDASTDARLLIERSQDGND